MRTTREDHDNIEKLDEASKKILRVLQDNSRLSLRKIAKKLRMKPTSVFNKIKKMENNGIIEEYTVILNRRKLNYKVIALILVTYKKAKITQHELALKISRFKQVLDVFIISGAWDLVLKVVAKDVDSLGNFITEKLRTIQEIDKTQTLIVLEEVKNSPKIPI